MAIKGNRLRLAIVAGIAALAAHRAVRRRSDGGAQIVDGRVPPPDDIQDDPAYEPEGPLKDIKGG